MKKDLMSGALLVGEAVASAGAFAAINVAKANTKRGTYAIGVKKDAMGLTTGEGGVDVDVIVGAALVLGAAFAPSSMAPHLAALGVGALATYSTRMGGHLAAKAGTDGIRRDAAGNVVAGIPGHGYLRGFDQRYLASAPDPYVSRYGFQTAAPVAAPGAHRF